MRNKEIQIFIIAFAVQCGSREVIKVPTGAVDFLVYFESRYRGICMGILVSDAAVLTAAVCVTEPTVFIKDTRPINVVGGTEYRHARRGTRIQVSKILLPKLPDVPGDRGYLMQMSVALLLLSRRFPKLVSEIAMHPINVDYKGKARLHLQEECVMIGWHFFQNGDIIYDGVRFLLKRRMRAQFLNVVKKHIFCEALSLKFIQALENFGFKGYVDKEGVVCVRDPDKFAQPCHGMYGAPLICRGRAVGMMLAPDAQWTNCTGHSNVIHMFHGSFIKPFMQCVSKSFFLQENDRSWQTLKKSLINESDVYDYVPILYDSLIGASSSLEL